MSLTSAVPTTAAVVVLAAALGACSDREAPAEQVVQAFYDAVSAGDGETACGLLAPATAHELETSAEAPCPEAILGEDVPERGETRSVDVFGTAAIVRSAGDTAFAGKFETGWRVVAVACEPRGELPFDCSVKGG